MFNSTAVNTLRWTKEPNNPTEAEEGTDVSLKWDYDLEGATFRSLEWIYIKTGSTIADRDSPSSKPFMYAAFSRFNVSETERATLIITNVNRTDTVKYSCKLTVQDGQNRPQIASTIQLKVICK